MCGAKILRKWGRQSTFPVVYENFRNEESQ